MSFFLQLKSTTSDWFHLPVLVMSFCTGPLRKPLASQIKTDHQLRAIPRRSKLSTSTSAATFWPLPSSWTRTSKTTTPWPPPPLRLPPSFRRARRLPPAWDGTGGRPVPTRDTAALPGSGKGTRTKLVVVVVGHARVRRGLGTRTGHPWLWWNLLCYRLATEAVSVGRRGGASGGGAKMENITDEGDYIQYRETTI